MLGFLLDRHEDLLLDELAHRATEAAPLPCAASCCPASTRNGCVHGPLDLPEADNTVEMGVVRAELAGLPDNRCNWRGARTSVNLRDAGCDEAADLVGGSLLDPAPLLIRTPL